LIGTSLRQGNQSFSDGYFALLIGLQKLRLTALTSLWHLMFLLDYVVLDIEVASISRDELRRIAICGEDGTNKSQPSQYFASVDIFANVFFWSNQGDYRMQF
jgi:hypothetical protein